MLSKAPFTLVLTPYSQKQMASQMLDSGADHNARVRTAELDARVADMIRGDFMIFQSALTSMEEHLKDIWRVLNLDPAVKESFGVLFMKQRKEFEATNLLYDNIVTRYAPRSTTFGPLRGVPFPLSIRPLRGV